MKTWREHPESEENQLAAVQNEREKFALRMQKTQEEVEHKIMNYIDHGPLSITEADCANIPVNCNMVPPDEEPGSWHLFADNFKPRRGYIANEAFHLEADSRAALMEVVQKHVVPLYEAALKNLKRTGHCYYWEESS